MFAYKIVTTTVVVLWMILLAWISAGSSENSAKGVIVFICLTYIAAIVGMWL